MAALLRRVDEVRKGEVFVGITEQAGDHIGNLKEGQSHLTVLELANIHEFGLGVPQRSFIREWQANYESTAKGLIKEEWRKALMGEQTPSQVITKLGKTFLAACRQNFVTFPFQPLADETVKRKGFDKPLIWSGQLYSSLTYRVIVGGRSSSDASYAIQFKDPADT